MSHLEDIVGALTKQFGLAAAHKLTDAPNVEVTGWTDTGSPAVNDIIGQDGIPDGRVTTIIGAPSSSKTTLATHIIAEHQKRGGIPILIPAEPFDRDRAIRIGVDPEKLIICDAGTAEDIFAKIDVIADNAPGTSPTLVVWDSFSASPTKAELEADKPGFAGMAMAEHARIVSQQMRKLQGKMEKQNITLVVVLQSKTKVGISFGSPVTYLAEKPWYFYSYVQLECKYIGHVKQGEKDIGIRVSVLCRKNKVGSPFKKCEIECMFEDGINRTGPILEMGVQKGIIIPSGNGRFKMPISDGTERKFTTRQWPNVLREYSTLEEMIKKT